MPSGDLGFSLLCFGLIRYSKLPHTVDDIRSRVYSFLWVMQD